jgi:hypothetical protein
VIYENRKSRRNNFRFRINRKENNFIKKIQNELSEKNDFDIEEEQVIKSIPEFDDFLNLKTIKPQIMQIQFI